MRLLDIVQFDDALDKITQSVVGNVLFWVISEFVSFAHGGVQRCCTPRAEPNISLPVDSSVLIVGAESRRRERKLHMNRDSL